MPETKPSLLIVDDDKHMRELLAAAADRSGEFSDVTSAPNGRVALEVVQRYCRRRADGQPEFFVLSDLSMPEMDGIELLRELKQSAATRGVPVAIMTSSNRPNDRQDATAAGCCAFFYKPARLDALTDLVRSLPRICGADTKCDAPIG